MTPHDRLRSMRTAALARIIDPWADAWEDGRPPEPKPARFCPPETRQECNAFEAPDWPEAPTEEVTP